MEYDPHGKYYADRQASRRLNRHPAYRFASDGVIGLFWRPVAEFLLPHYSLPRALAVLGGLLVMCIISGHYTYAFRTSILAARSYTAAPDATHTHELEGRRVETIWQDGREVHKGNGIFVSKENYERYNFYSMLRAIAGWGLLFAVVMTAYLHWLRALKRSYGEESPHYRALQDPAERHDWLLHPPSRSHEAQDPENKDRPRFTVDADKG